MSVCTWFVSALLLTLSVPITAICPSNGNLDVIYCSMGMGDNLYAFDTSGNQLDTVINKKSLPSNQVINKLRDMKFGPDGLLYVASSSTGMYSSIIALHGNGLINGSLNKDCTRNVSYVLTKFDAKSKPLYGPSL